MKLVELRNKLNRNAEKSWNEIKSTEIIKSYLNRKGITFKKLPKTGLIAYKNQGKPILLRAELDALPFGDEIKHACGHDVHATALAAALLEINKPVIGVFQPSEEDYPSGAKYVLDYIDNFKFAVAVHVDPDLAIGKIGLNSGYVMGSVDLIKFKLKGQTAHTATPDEGKDAILAAADLIKSISELDLPKSSVVISIINGGVKDNIVCDNVDLVGTLRTLDEQMRFEIKDKLKSICEEVKIQHDIKINFEFVGGYPALYNNPDLVEKIRVGLQEKFGKQNIVKSQPRLGNDDFAYFNEKGPICLIRVGCGFGKLHTKDFHPPDNIIEICKKVFVTCANIKF